MAELNESEIVIAWELSRFCITSSNSFNSTIWPNWVKYCNVFLNTTNDYKNKKITRVSFAEIKMKFIFHLNFTHEKFQSKMDFNRWKKSDYDFLVFYRKTSHEFENRALIGNLWFVGSFFKQ
jgi:hypothetical protein